MSLDRRTLLARAAALAALPLAGACASNGETRSKSTAPPVQEHKEQRILILGGTGFLGPKVVESALERGHTLTLFNRGRTNPELFPDLEKLRGDRDDDLDALRGREWDAVVDTSGYVPRHVRGPAELLAGRVRQYVFISTCSVYPDLGVLPIDESSRVGELEDPTVERIDGGTYGPLKVLCERAAEAALPGRTTVIRAGLIVGDGDTSDRFGYWPLRMASGGEVLCPGKPDWTTQFTDVRDLGAFVVRAIERGLVGTFNVDGPEEPVELLDLFEACNAAGGGAARLVWVEPEWLTEQGVRPARDLPLWEPPPEGEDEVPAVSSAKALAHGMRFRPVEETVASSLAWELSRLPREAPPRFGLTREREAELLTAWRAESRA
jgi:2'-hydroxyisoflavone reductase